MKPTTLIAALGACLVLNGCVVAAVADLAATTVVTAGKVAVKGTGALVRAAIPDGDDEEEKEKKAKKAHKNQQNQPGQQPQAVYVPSDSSVSPSTATSPAYYPANGEYRGM